MSQLPVVLQFPETSLPMLVSSRGGWIGYSQTTEEGFSFVYGSLYLVYDVHQTAVNSYTYRFITPAGSLVEAEFDEPLEKLVSNSYFTRPATE